MIIAEHEVPNDRRMIQQTKRSILIFESCISGGTNQKAADGRGKGEGEEERSSIRVLLKNKNNLKFTLKQS